MYSSAAVLGIELSKFYSCLELTEQSMSTQILLWHSVILHLHMSKGLSLYLCVVAGISKTQQKGTHHSNVDAAVKHV